MAKYEGKINDGTLCPSCNTSNTLVFKSETILNLPIGFYDRRWDEIMDDHTGTNYQLFCSKCSAYWLDLKTIEAMLNGPKDSK